MIKKNFYSFGQDAKDPSAAPDTIDPGPEPSVSTNPTKPSVPINTTKPATTSVAPKYTAQVSSAISEMQDAMQSLASDVIRDATSISMPTKPRDTNVADATQPVKKSRDSFNNFIAQQYMGDLPPDKKGVEWGFNENKKSFRDKQSEETDIYELNAVMNTLFRIGAPNQEFLPDGNWEFRTQNALKNTLGFAHALISLEGDFGLTNTSFNTKDLDLFSSIIEKLYVPRSGPGIGILYYNVNGKLKQVPMADKEQKATQIVPLLKKIQKLYDDFRQQITGRPEYRNVIDGRAAFDTYGTKGTKNKITPEDQFKIDAEKVKSFDQSAKVTGVKYLAPKQTKSTGANGLDYIPVKALLNKEEYLKWMEICGNSEETAIKILKVLKMQLEKSVSSTTGVKI